MLPALIDDRTFDKALHTLIVQTLAEGVYDINEIVREAGLSPAVVPTLLEYGQIAEEVIAGRVAWLSADNAPNRHRRKIDAGVELAIERIVRITQDPAVSPDTQVRAFQALMQNSSMQRERDEMRASANAGTNAGGVRDLTIKLVFPDGSTGGSLGRQPVTIEGEAA